MKLSDLLAETDAEELERLLHEHARADDQLSRPQRLSTLEGVLRSHRFLQEFLINRQPPAFAIITQLLDAPDFSLPTSGFREVVMTETSRLCQAVNSKAIMARDNSLQVYRRVLYQARSNDMLIDASEAALLSVLRHELGIPQVGHFLIEHHADLQEFWGQDQAFVRELHALRSAGLVYVRDGRTLIPDDLVQVVRNVLGLDMSTSSARRLYGYLSSQDLQEALQAIDAPTSGSKDDRIERLVQHMAQPRVILRLRGIGLDRLRDVCRDIGANVSGAKDELVDRIVGHVAAGRDIRREPEPPPPIDEPRQLTQSAFEALFSKLRGHELMTILGEFDLRRTGTKEQQVSTLWESRRAEMTLLTALSSSDLEGYLRRLDLKPTGTKGERIQRALEHFATSREAPISNSDDDGMSKD